MLSIVNEKRNRKLKYVITGMLFFLIFVLSYLYEMDKKYLVDENSQIIFFLRYLGKMGYLPRSLASGTMLLLAAALGFESKEAYISMDKKVMYLWILMNTFFIIAGLFHDIQRGFLFSQIAVFLALPMFYIGWINSVHGKDLYTVFSTAVIAFTLITVLSCIIWFPFGDIIVSQTLETGELVQNTRSTVFTDGIRYMGMMNNPSRVAHFATPGAICSLYLIFVWKGWKAIIPAISLGFSLAMSFLAISRASILSIILATVGFLILYFRKRKPYKKLGAMAMIVILSLSVCFVAVNRGQDHYHLFSTIMPLEVVYAETDSEVYEDNSEEEDSAIKQRFELSDSINDLSSGRIAIWEAFLSRLNLTGHDVRFDYPVRVNVPDNKRYFYFSYPHNVALDYAYRCGIPTGVFFLLLELMGYIYCFRVLFSRKLAIDETDVFAVMGLLAFLITGNVESVDHVFTRIILVVFYLSLLPLFAGRADGSDLQIKIPSIKCMN